MALGSLAMFKLMVALLAAFFTSKSSSEPRDDETEGGLFFRHVCASRPQRLHLFCWPLLLIELNEPPFNEVVLILLFLCGVATFCPSMLPRRFVAGFLSEVLPPRRPPILV